MTVLDSINAVSTADAALAAANQGVVAAQASVTAATAQVTTAQAADTAADQLLSADLQAGGPVFVVAADGSAEFYQYSTAAPGFAVTKAQPASSVNSTAPTPAPTPTPTPSSTAS